MKVLVVGNYQKKLGGAHSAMINTAKFCNLCIIPSDPNDLKKAVVSSNRLITALALGLPTGLPILTNSQGFK